MTDSKFRKIVSVIVVLLALIMLLLGLYMSVQGNDNWGQVSLGLGGGLLAWVLTYAVVSWIDISRGMHYSTTEEILDVVKEKFLSLKKRERKDQQLEFYEDLYVSAGNIWISGIANKRFVKYFLDGLLNKELPARHLIQQMRERPIKVSILLMHPCSEVIQMENRRDDPRRMKSHKDVVREALKNWREIYKNSGKLDLCSGSEIRVRINSLPLNSTLFYTSSENDKNGVMLMGMLWAHKQGTLSQDFEIPRINEEGSLYSDCREHFQRLWIWSENQELIKLPEPDGNDSFNKVLWEDLFKDEDPVCH